MLLISFAVTKPKTPQNLTQFFYMIHIFKIIEKISTLFIIFVTTDSTEPSASLEVNKSSVSQEILGISWNPKVHYRFHNSPLLVPVLSQVNQFQALSHDFFEIHFSITLQYTFFKSSKRPFCLRLSNQKPRYTEWPQKIYTLFTHQYLWNKLW
jgi:hypothetical protein